MERMVEKETKKSPGDSFWDKFQSGNGPFFILLLSAFVTLAIFWSSLYLSIETSGDAVVECTKCIQGALGKEMPQLASVTGLKPGDRAIVLSEDCLDNCNANPERQFWSSELAAWLAGMLISLSVVASLCVIWLKWRETIRTWEKTRTDGTKDGLGNKHLPNMTSLLVHVIPFGILNFALLFELEDVAQGEMNGMIAISGIMILFLLAQLAAHVIDQVKIAEEQAGKIAEQAGKINAQAKKMDSAASRFKESTDKFQVAAEGAEVIGPLLSLDKLLNQQDRSPVFAASSLLKEGGRLALAAKEAGMEPFTGMLVADMLTAFFSEAKADMASDIKEHNIPDSAKMKNLNIVGKNIFDDVTKKEFFAKGHAYFASNLTTYTKFLSDALDTLVAQSQSGNNLEGRVPFIITTTNHLSTHFFGAPAFSGDKEIERRIHFGTLRYYAAMKKLAENKGRVFRLTLVRDDGSERKEIYSFSKDWPLFTDQLRKWEETWRCRIHENGHPCLTFGGSDLSEEQSQELSGIKLHLEIDNEYREENLKEGWLLVTKADTRNGERVADDKGNVIEFAKGDERFILIRKRFEDELNGAYPNDSKPVIELYREHLHPEERGMTWIGKCSKDYFDDPFLKRNDTVFLGTYSKNIAADLDENPESIWDKELEDANKSPFEIYAAATTNISPESKTMFVTICYSRDAITKLWEQIRKAAQGIESERLFKKKPEVKA
uniref:Uncharacterized protein n=1 Tax=Candidatus Kentrum sp. TC TaxID=2126339 RepID=A0A450YVK8_9GAMM|nr:MAG: hypothetical protein BECKTC1821E_GA0114239_10518 [Candidatus Kentron sp. TC]